MKTSDLKLNEVWYGTHEGFNFEIRFRETLYFGKIADIMDKEEHWNYYVAFLPKNMPTDVWDSLSTMGVLDLNFDYLSDTPKEGRSERWICKYHESILANIFWHEGITFCEFIRDAKGTIKGVKAGCDYSHYHDEDCTYNLEYVMNDCISTISSFIERTSFEAQSLETSQSTIKE
jgi:hypothetical protein